MLNVEPAIAYKLEVAPGRFVVDTVAEAVRRFAVETDRVVGDVPDTAAVVDRIEADTVAAKDTGLATAAVVDIEAAVAGIEFAIAVGFEPVVVHTVQVVS